MSKLTLESIKDRIIIPLSIKNLTAAMEDIILYAKETLEKDSLSVEETIQFCCSYIFEALEESQDYCEQFFLTESDKEITYMHLSYKNDTIIFDEYLYDESSNDLNWFGTCQITLKDSSKAEVSWYYSDSFTNYLEETSEEPIYQVTTIIKLSNLICLDLQIKKQVDSNI